MGRDIRVAWWLGLTIAAVLTTAPSGILVAGSVQDQDTRLWRIGVVDFETPAALPSLDAIRDSLASQKETLGWYAAGEAETQEWILNAAAPRFYPIARLEMIQAESALRWRGSDITVPARLTALAARVRAAYLIIGTVDALDKRENVGSQEYPIYKAYATVHVQVFTVATTHFNKAAAGSAYWMSDPGLAPQLVVTEALSALASAVGDAARAACTNASLPP